MVKLVGCSGQLPSSLFIHGVKMQDASGPWRTGGFADIYHGFHDGAAIVVKRIRFHTATNPNKLRLVRTPFINPLMLRMLIQRVTRDSIVKY
jgi:hypothetical protein